MGGGAATSMVRRGHYKNGEGALQLWRGGGHYKYDEDWAGIYRCLMIRSWMRLFGFYFVNALGKGVNPSIYLLAMSK